jgi:hypothetical protein
MCNLWKYKASYEVDRSCRVGVGDQKLRLGSKTEENCVWALRGWLRGFFLMKKKKEKEIGNKIFCLLVDN